MEIILILTITAYFCLFATVVEARFDDINTAYRNYKSSENEASTLGKFASGLTILGYPKLNKYATEAALLDVSFKSEPIMPTIETMDLPGNSSFEVGYNYFSEHICC